MSQTDDMSRNNAWSSDRQSVPRASVQAQPQSVRPTPTLTPQASYNGNAVQVNRQASYTGSTQTYQNSTPNIPQQPVPQYQYNQQAQPTPIAAAHPGTYASMNTPMNYGRPAPTAVQAMQYNSHQMNSSARGTEAYVLSDSANASIPKEIRDQFPTDDQGRLLFFTQPPLDTQHIVTGSTLEEKAEPLQHSDQHRKALAIRKRKLEERQPEEQNGNDKESTKSKQAKLSDFAEATTQAHHLDIPADQIKERATALLTEQVKNATYHEYQQTYDDDWRKVLLADLDYQSLCQKKEVEKERSAIEQRRRFNGSHLGKLNGQYALNPQGYITDWRKDFFTGSYLDDYDSRLP